MDELKNPITEEDTEDTVVVITDEDGNKYNYVEEMVFPVGEDKYAILVSMDADGCGCGCEEHEEHHHEDGEECGCEEVDVILAKVIKDENGEVIYVEPSDEEFEQAQEAYEKWMDQMED